MFGEAFSPQEVEDPALARSPGISIRSLKTALRRRRSWWIVTAVVGLLIGAALHVVIPRKFSATSTLYLVEPASLDPTLAMQNDVSLVHTQSVAARALADLHIVANVDSFLSTIKGTGVSTSILSIKLTAPSAASAVELNNAVARAFLEVRAAQQQLQMSIVVSSFETQLTNLVNQHKANSEQATQLTAQIQQTEVAEASVVRGSRVLDSASVPSTSVKKVMLKDGLSGLVAGLGAGVIIVILVELLSDRLRRRADIAAALGTSVELSVGPLPWPRRRRGGLRKLPDKPVPALQMIERRLRYHVSLPGARLALVEVAATREAALAIARLAVSVASEGRRVAVVDAAAGRPLGSQRMWTGSMRTDGLPVHVLVAPGDPAQLDRSALPEDVDVVLVLAAVDPALGAENIAAWASDAVVMVRAGGASADRIDATGQLLRMSGVDVVSAIVVDADPGDQTSGLTAGAAPVARRREDAPRAIEAGSR